VGILDALQGRRTYLDTNVFIYALEGFAPFVEHLSILFAAIEQGEVSCVTSQLTPAELLVRLFRDGDSAKETACRQAIQNRRGLAVIPVSLEVLIEAARRRAAENLRIPDAIHLATAIAGGAVCFSQMTSTWRVAKVSMFFTSQNNVGPRGDRKSFSSFPVNWQRGKEKQGVKPDKK